MLALATGVLLMPVGCGDGGAPSEPAQAASTAAAAPDAGAPSRPQRVVLVSIDTLRADHLGTYGYERFTSPMLDMLAIEGTVFEDASSAAPWTLPSHATMLTGVYPRTHEVVTFETTLDVRRATLARMLGEAGYRTAAAVSTRWLTRDRYNLTKDFDDYVYVATAPDRRAPSNWITDQAIEWIEDAGDQPLFVFLHYFDVHGDYVSEPEYEALFVGPYDGPATGQSWQLLMSYLEPEYIEMCKVNFDRKKCAFGKGDDEKLVDANFTQLHFDARDIQHLIDRYDAGVRQMDTELGRLLTFLRKTDRLEDTLIIITSDHGEEFQEHGRLDHFMSTHQEVLRVPLIFRGPGVSPGRRIDSPVSLVDLAPTILELTNTPAPADFEGLSLVPLLAEDAPDDAPYRQRPLYGEAPGGLTYEGIVPGIFPVIRSIRRDNWKLIYDSKRDAYALYDLSTDPGETRDLAASKPAIAAGLAAEMKARYEGFTPHTLDNATVELSEEEIEELRALGYVP